MATKKFMGAVVGIFFIISWLSGFSTNAVAETLKGKGVGAIGKFEMLPVGDVENHNIGLNTREGMVVFENGEVATTKAIAVWDIVRGGSGWAKGYITFTFLDGSTITTNFNQQYAPAKAEGSAQYDTKITGDILKGTGKFEGVKGNFSATTTQMKAEKGESAGKSISDMVLTYSK
jgi:hypothetical protein